MKPFMKVEDQHKYLFNMGLDELKKKIVFAAIKLDLFTQLEEFKTAKEVAEKMKYDVKNTEYILNALTSIDLLEKKLGRYKNREISNLYLSKNSDGFAGDLIIGYDLTLVSTLSDQDIVEAIKEGGKSLYKDKDGLEAHKMYGDYTSILKKSQRIGRAKEICELVKELPEFKGFKKILDLGGGPGLIGIAIGREKEDVEGVVFDTPETIVITKECIEEYQMEERFSTLSGDYINDDIGNNYDFVLAIGTLNFAKNNLDVVTKKIYDSLNDGGVFMAISEGLVEEGTKPEQMVLGWFPSVLKGVDFHLDQGQVSEAALRSGFKSATRKTINSTNGIVDVDLLRK
ncbi:methyltransferase family protein [Crassaminicella profunda]|uniref:methyltransferase family protein n=1 Tax=Crassaminicella profunda TaxID=1286698 RepID=UPI001CA711B5|nr:methyltransferase dimerization domain-containing protein [Crassaminicella profunda]QZY55927.1 methyltransferase [Crassaminicella profunda]